MAVAKWAVALVLAVVFSAGAYAGEKPKGKDKLIHVVAVKFKEGTSAEDIQKVESEFRALKKKIDEIKDYEGGASVSLEKLNKGFEHCSILEFKDEAGLKAYIDHPAHKEFVELLKKHMSDVFVIDFWE